MLRLEDRLHGDKLLDALELIEEIKGVGGFVSENGMVLVYHRTTLSNAETIYKTGVMSAKEDGLFFSTKESGYNDGYGDAVVRLSIPVERLVLDDIFSDEAHLRLPLSKERSFDVSAMLICGDDMDSAQPGADKGSIKSKIETARVVMGGQLNSCRCTERQRKNDPLRS